MGFLQKLLEGATRQVNIFDNGKTWKNPQGNQSRPTPAQTPPPQSGNMNFAGSKTYGTFNRPSPVVNAAQKQIAQTPKVNTKNRYAQVNAPSYGSGLSGLLNRAKDVVDANTAQDRFKRTQIGQPEVVKPMQQQISERAKPIAQGFVEQYNQLGTGVGTLLAQNSKDVKNAQKAQQDLANQLHQQRMATIKLAKAPGVTQPQLNRLNNLYNDLNQKDVELQQQRTNQSNDLYSKLDPKKNLAALASVGFDIATLGYGTAGYQGVKQAGKQGFKAGAKELAKQAGITGSMGAVSGGLSPVVQKGDQATAGDIAKGAAAGFAFGAALPVATYGVGSGISKVKDPIQNALKNTGKALGDVRTPNPLPKTQGGFVDPEAIKNSFKGKPPKTEGVDPTAALKAEALKYGTAEEFVQSQGLPAYHRSPNKFSEFDISKVSNNSDRQRYGWGLNFSSEVPHNQYGDNLYEVRIPKGDFINLQSPVKESVVSKIIDEVKATGKNPSELSEFSHNGWLFYKTLSRILGSDKDASLFLSRNGIAGIENKIGKNANDYILFNNDSIKTKQQLNHLYNQAHTPQPKTEGVAPKTEPRFERDLNTGKMKMQSTPKPKAETQTYNRADANSLKVGDSVKIASYPNRGNINFEPGITEGKVVNIYDSTSVEGIIYGKNADIQRLDGTIEKGVPLQPDRAELGSAGTHRVVERLEITKPTPPKTEGVGKTPQQIKQSLNEGFLDIDTSDGNAVKGVFDNAGYVDNGGFKVHPDVDSRWVDDLSPETKQLMADEGITYIDPSPDQDVFAMAVQKNLGSNKVKGISVNSKKDAGLFTNKDSIVVHEIGHHKWNQLSPAEKAEWGNRPAQSEFGKRIEAGHQHSGAMKGEEEFAEQFAKSKTGKYGGGESKSPLTVVKKPTLQDALEGKSTKVTPKTSPTPPKGVAPKSAPIEKTPKGIQAVEKWKAENNLPDATPMDYLEAMVYPKFHDAQDQMRILTDPKYHQADGKFTPEAQKIADGISKELNKLDMNPESYGMGRKSTPVSAPIEKTVEQTPFGPVKATGLPKNQVESVVPEQNLSQKSPQQSQPLQTKTSQETLKNTSEPIIPTESVRTPEAFIPEAKLASQGKPPKQATAKLLDSAKKSDVIPEDMVQAIDPTRSVKTNKETWTKAGQKLHELGDDGALNYFHENHGADSNAVAWRLYEKRLARGDNKGAQELLADMTTRSIENGQAAQAWAMIKRLDPKYITQKLDRQVDTFKKSDKYSDRIKKRIDWSADKQARISKYATDMSNDSTLDNLARTNNKDEIAQITGIQDEGIIKGLSKTNDPERIKMLLTTNFNKEINSILPSNLGDKAVAYWKSGLLSAPVTHVRNIVGNTTNSAFNTVETPLAGLLDSTFGRALTPTKRTVSANPIIGQGKGYKQGGQDFADALRYGITKDDAGKFDYKSINWNKNNPIEQHIFKPFTDAIFRTLGAEDKIFKQPGVMHSLYNQADAAAISAGKRGDAKWMANWVENAPAIVKEQAKKEGGAWVFQKDTVVSSAMRGLKNAVKREHPGFEKVIDGIQPFVNVPAAIGSELLTYTPAGLLRVGNKARKALNKNIDMSTRDIYRREAMKDLSKTTVGGGLIAAGLAMGYSGDASGTMPPKNTKEYDVWMQENRQANSIRIGGKWFNINSIGPQASLFNAAAQTGAWMKRNEGKGKTNDPLTSAVAFGGNVATNWFNSSSLTGASNAQKAISDPVRYGQDYAARQLTSFIPNAAKRLGAGVDPNMREGDSFKDAVLAQIPFARTNAPVKTDSTGTPVVNNAYGAMGMKSLFDPFNISTAKDGGNSVVNKTANKSGMAVQDLKEAKAITKSGYGKEWAKLSEDEIKNKAIEGDQQAQQVYDSLQAMEKVYAPKNVPTKGLSQSAEDILNKSKKFTESGKKAWGAKPSDSNDAKTSLKNWMNGKDVPVTNEIAVEWAKYEQKRVKGELSPLEQNEAKTTLLRKAYSSSLNEDERKYYSVADDKLIGAVQKGWVSQDSINKALAVDKQLLELGLTTKSGFGKKVWNALGLSMPSVAGASSGIRSSGRKTSRVKSTKLKASKTPISFTKVKNRQKSVNSSLRKLLGSAKV